jgi:hypothetical protein
MPFAGVGQGTQLDPQELASVSDRQLPLQLWNPGAHGNVHLLATQAGSVPGGAFAVQSTQTFTPQSSGVFVHEPVTAFAERVVPGSAGGSFEPLPQAIDDSTETTAISLAMKVFPPPPDQKLALQLICRQNVASWNTPVGVITGTSTSPSWRETAEIGGSILVPAIHSTGANSWPSVLLNVQVAFGAWRAEANARVAAHPCSSGAMGIVGGATFVVAT